MNGADDDAGGNDGAVTPTCTSTLHHGERRVDLGGCGREGGEGGEERGGAEGQRDEGDDAGGLWRVAVHHAPVLRGDEATRDREFAEMKTDPALKSY